MDTRTTHAAAGFPGGHRKIQYRHDNGMARPTYYTHRPVPQDDDRNVENDNFG